MGVNVGADDRRLSGTAIDPALNEPLNDEDLRLLRRYESIFIGSYSHSLDGKGRMVVPQAFREKLGEKFFVAPSQDFKSIALYSEIAWARLRDRFARLQAKRMSYELIRFLEQFDAYSYRDQECDGQGRILLPARLRQKILGDEKDVEITGANDHVRVVAARSAEEQFAGFLKDLPDILGAMNALDVDA